MAGIYPAQEQQTPCYHFPYKARV